MIVRSSPGIDAASRRRTGGGGGGPAPVYSSVGTETQDDTVSTSTANRPATVASGDLLLMFVGLRPTVAATMSTPSGWTKIVDAVAYGVSNSVGYVFWRTAGGSEPSSWALSATATAYWQVDVVRVTGANASAPIDQVATQLSGTGTTVTCPTVTTTGANRLIACVSLLARAQNVTPPGSLTERYDNTYATPAFGQAFGDAVQAAAGATGTFVWTRSSEATRQALGVTIAVAP